MMWPAKVEHIENSPSQPSANSTELLTGQSVANPTPVSTMENLNIIKSSHVHIGPKFVSVTQNLQKTQVVKVRLLGLDLGPLKYTKRRNLALFAYCNFIAAAVIAMYFIYLAVRERLPQLDIGLRTSWYLRRADWQAMDPHGIEYLDLPVSHVIITHTETHYCNYRYLCIAHILGLQQDHMLRGFSDISPNFLVSGNGLVFEGRGANIMGSMVRYWNAKSIMVAFMGDYMSEEVVQEQFDHINVLLDVLVRNGVLRQDYTLYAHCQVQRYIDSPGLNVIKEMERFVRWSSQNSTGCTMKLI